MVSLSSLPVCILPSFTATATDDFPDRLHTALFLLWSEAYIFLPCDFMFQGSLILSSLVKLLFYFFTVILISRGLKESHLLISSDTS